MIFLQHTEHSKLAHNIREKLRVLESVGSFKIKIVERTGSTLVDTLHKSNAWADQDCLREDCRICTSTIKGVKKGSCRRRNVTYETFCITCQKQEQEKLLKEVQENSDRMSTVVDDDPIEYLCELFNDNLENSLVARFEKSTSNRYKLNSSSADENRLEQLTSLCSPDMNTSSADETQLNSFIACQHQIPQVDRAMLNPETKKN